MAANKRIADISTDELAAARQRAKQTRDQLKDKPHPSELLTPEEIADGAPFYLALQDYIRQLRKAREAANLTLEAVSAKTGIPVESLSALETGAQTNPTWKTLGTYAAALGRRIRLYADPIADSEES